MKTRIIILITILTTTIVYIIPIFDNFKIEKDFISEARHYFCDHDVIRLDHLVYRYIRVYSSVYTIYTSAYYVILVYILECTLYTT